MMLAQFSVENFMSFKDRSVLNLTASNGDKDHLDNITRLGNTRCLKSAVIYGANASGKSNLLKAMNAAITIIQKSHLRQIDERLSDIVPFLFDNESPLRPSSFEFIFFVGGVQYIYGFSATQEKVIDEYLYVYRSRKPSMIFERSDTDEYRFNKADEKEFSAYREKNTKNKLFLSTATIWNCEKTKEAFMWLSDSVIAYSNIVYSNNDNLSKKTHAEISDGLIQPTAESRHFTLSLLKNADINIDDFRVIQEEHEAVDPREFRLRIKTTHSTPDRQAYELDFGNESYGTQSLFIISPVLYNTLMLGRTLFIDEMSCLHSELVRYLVGLFNDPDVNKTNAQLIFITHDTILLNLNAFRRDQIYFIEKDDYGVSDLYSLDDFSVRKSENIRTAYLIGRYGAVPVIRNGDLL